MVTQGYNYKPDLLADLSMRLSLSSTMCWTVGSETILIANTGSIKKLGMVIKGVDNVLLHVRNEDGIKSQGFGSRSFWGCEVLFYFYSLAPSHGNTEARDCAIEPVWQTAVTKCVLCVFVQSEMTVTANEVCVCVFVRACVCVCLFPTFLMSARPEIPTLNPVLLGPGFTE